jgi:hypothetical protein
MVVALGGLDGRAMKSSLPVLALATLLSMPAMNVAHAEMDANTLLRTYDAATPARKAVLSSIILAIKDGIGWANEAFVKQRNELALYCVPSDVTLTGTQLIDLIRQEVRQNQFIGEYPFGMAMLHPLQVTYPSCHNQSSHHLQPRCLSAFGEIHCPYSETSFPFSFHETFLWRWGTGPFP